MSKTILITGASTGIGRATAEHFQQAGWNVVATMRNPEKGAELATHDNVLVTRLDVLDRESVDAAIAAGIERFGAIDALLNNAGYGAYGPLEAFPAENIRRQFDTNVLGLLAVTQAVLPHMRSRKSGTIANVSSVGGKAAFPLGALYHGTKFAVEGISDALHYELEPLGIRVKLIEPGMIATDFGGRSFDFQNDESLTEYQPLVQKLMGGFEAAAAMASPPAEVAEVIYDAITSDDARMRYPAAGGAEQILAQRADADDASYFAAIKQQFGI